MALLARRLLPVLAVMLMATAWVGAQIANGGFEDVGADGKPAGWMTVPPFQAAALTEEQPHSGLRATRLVGDGKAHAWRQEVPGEATRIYRVSGWFRAQDVKLSPQQTDEDFARFYIHIHYKDRPYSDASHIYANLPVGSYDWKRVALRLVPHVQWPIEKLWVTVVGQFRSGTLDCDDIEIAPLEGGSGWSGPTARSRSCSPT
jgi:hypothetical protein